MRKLKEVRQTDPDATGWFMEWASKNYARMNTKSDGTGDTYLLDRGDVNFVKQRT